MPIGEIITQADVKHLAASSVRTDYISPTVYRPANGISGWNYYSTAKDALLQWLYINKVPGYDKIKPVGAVTFKNSAATTLGINVDFFVYSPILGAVPANYTWVKEWSYKKNKFPTLIFRFYKTDGSGPFYAVLDNRYLYIAATVVTSVEPRKLILLQQFNNSVQLLKGRYNSLAKLVSDLSKRQKTVVEQQVFDESLLTLLSFERQLRQLKGVDIVWTNSGQISGPDAVGLLPLVWVTIIAVSGIVAAYTVDKITAYLANAKAIEQANNTVQFVETQRLKIAQALKENKINREDSTYLEGKLNEVQKAAQKNITDVSMKKEDGIFDKATNLLLVGGGIYLLTKIIK
jgi:hypothetical protein